MSTLKCLFVCTGSHCVPLMTYSVLWWWKPNLNQTLLTKKKVYFIVRCQPFPQLPKSKGWEDLAMWLNSSVFSVVQFRVSWSFCINLQYSLLLFFHMECIFKCKLFLSYLSIFSLLKFKLLPLSRKETCSFNLLVMAKNFTGLYA